MLKITADDIRGWDSWTIVDVINEANQHGEHSQEFFIIEESGDLFSRDALTQGEKDLVPVVCPSNFQGYARYGKYWRVPQTVVDHVKEWRRGGESPFALEILCTELRHPLELLIALEMRADRAGAFVHESRRSSFPRSSM